MADNVYNKTGAPKTNITEINKSTVNLAADLKTCQSGIDTTLKRWAFKDDADVIHKSANHSEAEIFDSVTIGLGSSNILLSDNGSGDLSIKPTLGVIKQIYGANPTKLCTNTVDSSGYLNIVPSGGRVGILTASPTEALHVTGNIRASGSLEVTTTKLTNLTTGLVKSTSIGVLLNASSGSDYAPATSGSAILKGNGSGGFSNATSGSDYAPATSGSAILKGNGSGGFSNASAGTDYLVATEETFTLTMTGPFASNPTVTATYVKLGNIVHLFIPYITATANNGGQVGLSGLPVAIQMSGSTLYTSLGWVQIGMRSGPGTIDISYDGTAKVRAVDGDNVAFNGNTVTIFGGTAIYLKF